MSESITYTCDCGWFELSQFQEPRDDDDPKLQRELHFSSLKCLGKWIEKAIVAVPKLQASAYGLHPRGTMNVDSVKGLYI